jgi:hypothetical protein
MEANIRRKLSMAARVLDFARAHPSADASYSTLVSRLVDRVTRGDALAVQQVDGHEGEHAAVARRDELRRSIVRLQVKHLVRTADLATRDHPELAGQFFLPRSGGPLKVFITAAKAMLAAATPQKDLFLKLGIGDTFFDEFTKSVGEFDTSTEAAHGRRRDHVGARADLKAVADECVKLVGLLDGIYRTRFRSDTEALAAWDSARIVIAVSRSKGGETPPAPPAPAGSEVRPPDSTSQVEEAA